MIVHEQSRRGGGPGSTGGTRVDLLRAGPAAQAALIRALRDAGQSDVAAEVGKCCQWPLYGQDVVVIYEKGESRTIGLNHCKRLLCPICAPFLIQKHVGRLRYTAERLARQDGLHHLLLTLSLQHGPEAPWKALVNTLMAMMNSLRGGKQWRNLILGYARVLESTHGAGGHHPHLHVLASVQAPEGWDCSGFSVWVEKTCERVAARAGMACLFTDGWCKRIPSTDLSRTVSYFRRRDKWGQVVVERGAPASTGSDHRRAIWAVPAAAYAEIWCESKGTHWFSSSGCWKAAGSTSTPSDSVLTDGATHYGNPLCESGMTFVIPADVIRSWTGTVRRDRLAFIENPGVPAADRIATAIAWGVRVVPIEETRSR